MDPCSNRCLSFSEYHCTRPFLPGQARRRICQADVFSFQSSQVEKIITSSSMFSHSFPMIFPLSIHFQSFFSHFGWWLCIRKGPPHLTTTKCASALALKPYLTLACPLKMSMCPAVSGSHRSSVSLRFRPCSYPVSHIRASSAAASYKPSPAHKHFFYLQLQIMV